MSSEKENLISLTQDKLSDIKSRLTELLSEVEQMEDMLAAIKEISTPAVYPDVPDTASVSHAFSYDIGISASYVVENEESAFVENSDEGLVQDDLAKSTVNEEDVSEEMAAEHTETEILNGVEEKNEQFAETPQPFTQKKDGRLVTDLKKAIGLNDKFRFRHNLFNNDNELMMSSIEKLNNMSSFDEALHFLRENFTWNEEDDTVQYFFDILHRRYYR